MDMQQAQQAIVQTLQGVLDPERQKAAEAALGHMAKQAGFSVVLVSVLANQAFPLHVRQLAGVVLRQHVSRNWNDEDDYDEEEEEEGEAKQPSSTISDTDKDQVKAILPSLLADPDSKLRTAASMVIAAIAVTDFPDKWPTLIKTLVDALQSSNPILVQGGLRCFVLLADDVTDEVLVKLLPVLQPLLLRILSAQPQPLPARALMRCLTVYRILASSLMTITNTGNNKMRFEDIMKHLLLPTLPSYLSYIAAVLSSPPPPKGTETRYGLKLECVKVLRCLVEFFPAVISSHLSSFLPPLWSSLQAALPEYESDHVNGDDDDDAYDADGDAIGLPAFLYESLELFELFCKGKDSRKLLQASLKDLASFTIGCMQITQAETDLFEKDLNEFIAYEDASSQSYSVRLAGNDLLHKLVLTFEEEAVKAISTAAGERLGQAQAMQAKGVEHWWKVREAASLAMGYVADSLPKDTTFDVASLVKNVIIPDLQPSCSVVYLRARAVWAISHWVPVLHNRGDQALLSGLVQALVGAMQNDQPPHVRLAATRAFGLITNEVPLALVSPYLPAVLPLLCQVLGYAKGESLHMTLETLNILVKLDAKVTVTVESAMTPLLLQIWNKNTEDRMVCEGVLEILQLLMEHPQSLPSILKHTVPVLHSILGSPDNHPSGVLEGALDLLCFLVRSHAKHQQPTPQPLLQTLPVVIKLLLTSDDSSAIESGLGCLIEFMRAAHALIAQAQYENGPMLNAVCGVVARMLAPQMPENAAYKVGPLVSELLSRCSETLGQATVINVIKAVVSRLYSSEHPEMIQSLLMLLARCVHSMCEGFLNFLEQIGNIDVKQKVLGAPKKKKGEKYARRSHKFVDAKANAFEFVLSKWVEEQPVLHMNYPNQVTFTALGKLLMLKSQKVAQIPCKGAPIVDQSSKRRTRSAGLDEQFSKIPVPTKILILMANEWKRQVENKEKKSNDDDEEDEDELSGIIKGGKEGGSVFADAEDYADFLDGDSEYVQLSDLLNDDFNDDDIDELEKEEFPERDNDPLSKIVLQDYLHDFVCNFAKSEPAMFQAFIKFVTPEQGKVLQELLKAEKKQ